METQQGALSVVTLANASEAVATIATGVMGSAIASTFNGSPLTKAALHELAQVEFQRAFTNHIGGRNAV